MKIDENGIRHYSLQEKYAMKKHGVWDDWTHDPLCQLSDLNYSKYVKAKNFDIRCKRILGFMIGFFMGFAPIVVLMFFISVPLLMIKWVLKGLWWFLTAGKG